MGGLMNADPTVDSVIDAKPNENDAQTDVSHSKDSAIKYGNQEDRETPKGTITLSLEKKKHWGPASKRKHSLTSSDSEDEDPEPKLAKLEMKVEASTDDIHS